MKIKLFLPLLSLSVLSAAGSALFSASFLTRVDAADTWEKLSNYKTASLPKNIDLNPVAESDVRAYYAALDGKDLQGEELLKARYTTEALPDDCRRHQC